MAQRIGTREWLHRDLPLSEVERTKTLSGPGGITATIKPELRDVYAADGLRVIEEWATYIYAVPDDGGDPVTGGIVVDCSYEEEALKLTAAGFTTYPHGTFYDDSTLWGPRQGTGTIANPEIPRPDPVKVAQDLWVWIQSQDDSDLGVSIVGDLSSSVRVGSYEEPYRLRWWELPDIGSEIDSLAELTPFEYKEEYQWNADGTDVNRRLRFGVPRLGRRREDLRFVLGENIALPTTAATTGGDYANHVLGIGNGEGRKMIRADSTVRDGHLRRTRVVTDKTITSQSVMQTLVTVTREKMSETLDITSVAVTDSVNAPISAIHVGDDILVQTFIPSHGVVELWVRVLSVTEGDNPGAAVLATQRSSAFLYSSTTEVG